MQPLLPHSPAQWALGRSRSVDVRAANRIARMHPLTAATALLLLLLLTFPMAATARVLAPSLPEHFSADFTEFTAPLAVKPPFVNGEPPAPFWGTRGKTYYDWPNRRMIEIRKDFCVNIFGFSNLFPCTFHNINGTSYLYSENTTGLPPCCVFGQPWNPPPPGFLRNNVTAMLARRSPWNGQQSDWFIVPSILPPTGPFWFAFKNYTTSPQVYLSFSFPGMEGWVQQNFWNVSEAPIDPTVWDLPPTCLPTANLPNCGFFDGTRQPGVSHIMRVL